MKFLIIRTSVTFAEICVELKTLISERGLYVEEIHKSEYNKSYKKEFDIFIVVGMYAFNPGIDHKNKVFVGWHTEWYPEFYIGDRAMDLYCYRRFKKVVNGYDLILTPTRDQHEYLKSKGYPSLLITLGYTSSFDYQIEDNTEESYDILFYGKLKPRRIELVNILSKYFKLYPKIENLYGVDEKRKAFSKSKVCLDLKSGESLAFHWLRFSEILSNRKPIIAEFSHDSFPYICNTDYLLIHKDKMIKNIEEFLCNQALMNEMAINAYKRGQKYSLEKNIDRLLTYIEHLHFNSRKRLYRVIRLINATKLVKLDYENAFPYLPF